MSIRFGNAPCSWGTIEGFGQGIGYRQMLDELVETGYRGTELGDWGYMPTEPEQLRQELQQRSLTMLGAYQGVYLKTPLSTAPARLERYGWHGFCKAWPTWATAGSPFWYWPTSTAAIPCASGTQVGSCPR